MYVIFIELPQMGDICVIKELHGARLSLMNYQHLVRQWKRRTASVLEHQTEMNHGVKYHMNYMVLESLSIMFTVF